MRPITLYITENEYSHFVQLAKNLHYVKIIKTDEDIYKQEILKNLRDGFEEMDLIKKGKIKTTPLKDFLNKL